MFHIARNARLDHFRKHDVDITVLDKALDRPGDEPFPLDQLVRDQTNALLNRALLELSPDNRELLVLARYQELQYSEISELLGVEVGVVKVRVHRAVKELRELFLKLSGEKKSWTVKNSETSLRTI